MGVTREEVEIYLSEVFESIHAGRYQIAIRPNKYLFVISLHKQEYPLRYRFK